MILAIPDLFVVIEIIYPLHIYYFSRVSQIYVNIRAYMLYSTTCYITIYFKCQLSGDSPQGSWSSINDVSHSGFVCCYPNPISVTYILF